MALAVITSMDGETAYQPVEQMVDTQPGVRKLAMFVHLKGQYFGLRIVVNCWILADDFTVFSTVSAESVSTACKTGTPEVAATRK
jgi:hypothetical protein